MTASDRDLIAEGARRTGRCLQAVLDRQVELGTEGVIDDLRDPTCVATMTATYHAALPGDYVDAVARAAHVVADLLRAHRVNIVDADERLGWWRLSRFLDSFAAGLGRTEEDGSSHRPGSDVSAAVIDRSRELSSDGLARVASANALREQISAASLVAQVAERGLPGAAQRTPETRALARALARV